METEHVQIVQLTVASVITIASAIIGTLASALAVLFYKLEKKNDAIVELTKSFIHTTMGVTATLENNTKVIEKLPETIAMHIKANKK